MGGLSGRPSESFNLLSVAGADSSTGFPSPSFSSDMRSAPAPRLGFPPGRRRRDWRDATQLDERRPAIIGECMERGEPNALMLAGWNPAGNDSASRHAPSSSAAASNKNNTLCCIPTNSAGGRKKRKKQNCPWNFHRLGENLLAKTPRGFFFFPEREGGFMADVEAAQEEPMKQEGDVDVPWSWICPITNEVRLLKP